jgi:hypothetical protein
MRIGIDIVRREGANMNSLTNSLKVTVERDSVCAGDDVDAPHSESIWTRQDCTLAHVLECIRDMGYLARISGGRATWIVESNRPLAVMAQQWNSPRFLVAPETRLVDCADLSGRRSLFFRYWCQVDPGVVFDCLAIGQPLPDKYGRK